MKQETQKQILALEAMGTTRLRQRYAEVFGETTLVQNKAWLIKRIAWRLQAIDEGDLSERARQRAMELANDADLRLNPPKATTAKQAATRPRPQPAVPEPVPPPPAPATTPANGDSRLPPVGSVITRTYKGRELQVLVLAGCFAYEGKSYPSLSAVAKAITGSHCNGFLFFKLNGGDR